MCLLESPADGKCHVDHVAVGPGGVFAIVVKCLRKKASRNELKEQEVMLQGEVLRFPWCDDMEAVGRARGNARWLAQFLSNSTGEQVSVFPIIALPGWFVLPHEETDFKVLNGKQVAGHILSAPARLSDELAGQIAFQLERLCRDVEF